MPVIPVYLAEMQMLHETHPEIYEEFRQGNWVVNKNYVQLVQIMPWNTVNEGGAL